MKPFDYAIADTKEAALAAVAAGWKPKSGGIDLVDLLKERILPQDKLVSLREIDILRGVQETNDALEIGSLTTMHDVGRDPLVKKWLPALALSAEEAATPQIRAVATIGGNLLQRPRCWYFRHDEFPCLKKGGATCFAVEGENQYHAVFGGGPCHIVHPSNVAPPLVAAGAEFVLETEEASRVVKAGDFFVLPSVDMEAENSLRPEEVLTKIRLPRRPAKSGYVEFRHKQSFDWPMAACAAVHDGSRWNVVLGAAAPIPWRAKAAEEVLAGADSIDEALAERAADAALEGAEPMSRNAWRLKLVRAAVRRALLMADGKEVKA